MILMGLIWGVWHWPLVAMGHNYGQNYPGSPWLGMLAITWFTFVAGTFLGRLALRGDSVWRSRSVLGRCARHRLRAGGGEPLRATEMVTGLSLLCIAIVDDLVEGLTFAEICASVSSAREQRGL